MTYRDWDRVRNDVGLPPEQTKVRAIDVKPHHWGVWCTVGDRPEPFVNEIVTRKWSEDGSKILFMLDTHNFMSADPEEVLDLVEMPLSPRPELAALREERDRRDDERMANRPTAKG